MTIEELEQLKAVGKYQQLKSAISMQGYQPGQYVAPYNAYEMTNYGKNLQAQAKANTQEEKIAQLEQQIAQVKERIARNTRTLYGKSYDDANKKLATLEMDKIGVRLNRQPAQSDPTMLWRWNQDKLDTLAENANVKAKAAEQFANTVDMWVNTRPAPTTEGIIQQISNINSAIRDGRNAGADVSRLVAKKGELESLVYGDDSQSDTGSKYGKGTDTEKLNADVEDTISAAKTSTEIAQYIKKYKKFLKPEQVNKLNNKRRELEKKEIAKADTSADENEIYSIFGGTVK